jgi:glycolate oxidase FAD binding subunit
LGLDDIQPGGHPPAWWGRYPFRLGEVAVRMHTPDGHLHTVHDALAEAIGTPVPVRGSIGSGVGWACLPGGLPVLQLINVLETVREILLARGGTAVVQSAPHHLRDVVAPYRHP